MNKPQHAAGRGYRHALHRRVTWTLLAVLFISWGGPAANAFWQSLSSSNFGAAKADTMPQGGAPTAALNGTNATVTWAAVATPGGHAVTGYTVARYSAPAGGTKIAAGGGCAGTVTSLSCVEQNLPAGTWYYTVTPVISLWTGVESARSGGVTSDSTPPTISVSSISPAPNGAGFNRTSTVTVNLAAVDNTGGSGVANIKYAVDGGTTVTVNAATAAVNVTGDGNHSVSYSATDVAGNASTPQAQTVKIDATAPVVGASISPTPNSLGYNRTSTVTVNLSATDVGGSGVASITYKVDGGTPATVNAATAAVNVSGADGTHTVSYSAMDVAGNVTSQSQAVNIDTTAPTVSSVTMANGSGATQKKADAKDTLTIVFSTDMDPHTLCSNWDFTSGSPTANGTASISTTQVLTFNSTSCAAPSFGSVALGDAYNTSATSSLDFTSSTMAWSQSTGTLVITLGGTGTGGVAGTGAGPQTPIYSPATGAADTAGNLVGTINPGGKSKF